MCNQQFCTKLSTLYGKYRVAADLTQTLLFDVYSSVWCFYLVWLFWLYPWLAGSISVIGLFMITQLTSHIILAMILAKPYLCCCFCHKRQPYFLSISSDESEAVEQE